MPSPFPGMDPYLEGALWLDVHSALAAKVRQLLAPQVRPRYVVRLAVYLVEDTAPEGEIGILYPDVEVLRPSALSEAAATYAIAASPFTPAVLVPAAAPFTVRVPEVEIRDAGDNRLVTAIEILSPVNKREPGLSLYRRKRQQLQRAGVHLIEIDLIRRGQRPCDYPTLPSTPYLITLLRSRAAHVEAWPLTLDQPLPTIPVPLRPPDADAVLDLQAALTAIYVEAGYDLSIDYNRVPPPPPIDTEPHRTFHQESTADIADQADRRG